MRKCKLIYSERKKKTKMSGCLGTKCGDSEEGGSTEAQETSEVMDMFTVLVVVLLSLLYTYMKTFKIVHFKYSLLYIKI